MVKIPKYILEKGRTCCKCDKFSKNYKDIPNRYFDKNGNWDLKSYLCHSCYVDIYYPNNEKYKAEYNEYVHNELKKKFEKRECCKCGSKDTYTYQGSEKWMTCECCTGYICMNCYDKGRYNNNGGNKNDEKLLRNSRTGELYKYSEKGKGLIFESSVIKVRQIINCNIDNDNFNFKFDTSCDKEYGILQIKGRVPYYKNWKVYFNHNFDTLFFLCLDKGMNDIVRIYAIPVAELYGISGLEIIEDDSIYSKWKRFRLEDISSYNNAYHSLISYLGNKDFFGVEDIKKWLEGS